MKNNITQKQLVFLLVGCIISIHSFSQSVIAGPVGISVSVTGSRFSATPADNMWFFGLHSFKGEAKSGRIHLQWVTSQEINARSFEVQRSTNGHIFTTIATVQAVGSSERNMTYTYTDRPGSARLHFYRVKMIDQDANATYSQIIPVTSGATPVRQYSNPDRLWCY
jgi:hypothetical protein